TSSFLQAPGGEHGVEVVVVGAHLAEGVAAELLEEGIGEDEGDHGLGDDAGGWNDADVAALVVSEDLLAGVEVDGGKGVGEGGDGLDGGAHDDGLAGGDAALDA